MNKNRPSTLFRKTPIALAIAAFAGAVGITAAAPGDPLTGEIPVNTFTTNTQNFPAVAMDADGDFVVAWQGFELPFGYGVFARRFASDGTPLSAEIPVNTVTTGTQAAPAVAMDADGDFVVVWHSEDGGSFGVFARRFASDGTPLSAEIPVNAVTTGNQASPAVAMDADGDFVVTWASTGQDGGGDGVFARPFDADGTPASSEIPVNTFTTGNQGSPAVALDADGDFVVTWQSYAQDGSSDGVFARRFAADGTPASAEIPVNTFTTSNQTSPSVALDADGDFVVAWHSNTQDGSSTGVFARHFDADGTPASAEIPVNTFTTGSQINPSVALDADGDFVVTWRSYGQDGSFYGVFARRFAFDGTPVSAEIPVNTFTTGNQRFPSVAMDAGGDFVVAWQSYLQDGEFDGVFARLFEGGLSCAPTPRVCTELPAGALSLKNSDTVGKDGFKYKGSGADTTGVPGLFGDPTTTTENALCVYNANGLVMQLIVDATELNSKGNPAWKIKDGKTKFSNSAGNTDGVTKVQQKPGEKAKLSWSAGKANYVIPTLPFTDFPIVVQNQISGSGACTETTFEEAAFTHNGVEKVKAKKKAD